MSNIELKALRGLSYLKYQEYRLTQFLNKNTGMKILIQVDIITKSEADIDDEGNHVRKEMQFKVEGVRY